MNVFQYDMTDEQKDKFKSDLKRAVANLSPEQREEMRNPTPFVIMGHRVDARVVKFGDGKPYEKTLILTTSPQPIPPPTAE
jgi:hypothetical protein